MTDRGAAVNWDTKERWGRHSGGRPESRQKLIHPSTLYGPNPQPLKFQSEVAACAPITGKEDTSPLQQGLTVMRRTGALPTLQWSL